MAPVSEVTKKLNLLTRLYKKTLSTPQNLWNEARKTIPSLKLQEVKEFLQSQPNYLRTTKTSYKKYPKSLTLRHIIIGQPLEELFMDTWYLKRTITAHFCFVIICGFTKFLWVRFSKVLNAEAATKALKSVLDSLPDDSSVHTMATDRGPEFKGQFSLFLASQSIRQIFMTGPNKTSIGERIIR